MSTGGAGVTVARMDLDGEFTRVLGALNAEGIRYAVAGGLGVATTADVPAIAAGWRRVRGRD